MGNGGLLVEITGALFRGCYVPSVLSRSQTPVTKSNRFGNWFPKKDTLAIVFG
ncbi:hypothetical protein PMIN07_000071 [Paraphaeosphaeria minitans]